MVLILCITSCGSALLFSSLIYCKSNNTGFIVKCSYKEHSLRGSVVLPCFIDPQLIKKGLKVEWRRSRLQSPVCVYQDEKIKIRQDYHDRAHFFTEDITQGNFSLLLKNLTAEDEGRYTCKVHTGQRSVFSVNVILKHQGPRASLKYFCDQIVPLKGSVVLPCLNDKLSSKVGLKVKWSKSGLESPVCVYQDEDIKPETQHQDYQDRAHFFTEDIKHGNFSLRLEEVRSKDEGQYTCKVYIRQKFIFSLYREVFSVSTQLVRRHQSSGSVFHLHMFLVFSPNLIMFFAFIFWGLSGGSVNETICCCALYILRPLMLLFAAPYVNEFNDNIKRLVYIAEYFVLTAVIYSALFTNTLEILLSYTKLERVLILTIYAVIFLCCFSKIMNILAIQIGNGEGQISKLCNVVADVTFNILPILQFILLFYTFGSFKGAFVIVAVLPVLIGMTNERMFRKCFRFGWKLPVMRTVWFILTLVLNVAMIGIYVYTLENKTDPVGWGCVIVFLQILWAVVRFTDRRFHKFSLLFRSLFSVPPGFHRFVTVYLFGSVGVVFIGALGLMTELILKTVNGERAVMDLRFIVFPSECFFVMSVMILGQLKYGE
nr:uncharacterized protein LOC129436716 [Misgurnus anguillicaudatus]